ncbi:hypothetical protein [Microbacterium sp. NPDC064584]|uniref:hypothetical protein n=1 Tax=Microbacterium sp. NPDC064584 TaxID=3155817 RepID=UPI00341A9766
MTLKHRNRLLTATALVTVVLGICVAPVFADQGPATGWAVLALSAILPAVLLGAVALVLHRNDKQDSRSRLVPDKE